MQKNKYSKQSNNKYGKRVSNPPKTEKSPTYLPKGEQEMKKMGKQNCPPPFAKYGKQNLQNPAKILKLRR